MERNRESKERGEVGEMREVGDERGGDEVEG